MELSLVVLLDEWCWVMAVVTDELVIRGQLVSFHIKLGREGKLVDWSIIILMAFDVADMHSPHLLKELSNGLDQIPLCSHGVIHKDWLGALGYLVDCCD
jgi:hypothetical protein